MKHEPNNCIQRTRRLRFCYMLNACSRRVADATRWTPMLRRLLFAMFPLGSLLLIGCGLPCIGSRVQTPARHIVVVDTAGQPLMNYDLYVYRCTNPGSKAGRVFYFPARKESDFDLPRKSEAAIKRLGGVWLSPHVYESYEPQPYWVAAVNKPGYKSRRWSLDETQGDPVTIVLERSADPGEDYCDGTIGDCNPCRFHEYFMYQVMRYCHSDCHPESNPQGGANGLDAYHATTALLANRECIAMAIFASYVIGQFMPLCY
jgi:hypothetical protein